MGEAERKDGKRYLDVVDLHNYPYWTPNDPKPADMLRSMLDVGPNMDTLDMWMKRHLEGERRVFLSEFSTCVQGYSLLMDYPQATAMASVFAQHAMRFGNRLQVLPWDAFGNLFKGPDDTWGTISMTALLKEGSWNHWKSLEPTAEYYGVYMTFMDFLESGFAVLPVESNSPDVVAYAIGKGDSVRVMLVNLSDITQLVQIDRASVGTDSANATPTVGKGDLVRTQVEIFGEEQFKWNGTTQSAYPYPKMGPSGRRINPSKSRDIAVPPFGLAVVQINPKVVGLDSATKSAAADPKVIAAAQGLYGLNVPNGMYHAMQRLSSELCTSAGKILSRLSLSGSRPRCAESTIISLTTEVSLMSSSTPSSSECSNASVISEASG